MDSQFVCGYVFKFCGDYASETYYTMDSFIDYQNTVLSSKSANLADNNYLDYRYFLSDPSSLPATFNVLWLSDIELDLAYQVGKSKVCKDEACCHKNDTTTDDAEKAP